MKKNNEPGLSEKILSSAVAALHTWNTDGLTLDECIEKVRAAEPETARTVASILFEYFRHKSLIDELITGAAATGKVKPALAEVAACALSQALFQTAIAKESAVNIAVDCVKKTSGRGAGGFMNALLRHAIRNAGNGPFQPSFPEKAAQRWKKNLGAAAAEEARKASGTNPKLTFRLREGENVPPELEEAGILEIKADFLSPFHFYSVSKPEILLNSKVFHEGKIYIQDPATAMSAAFCRGLVHGKILDACAAPGGKTIMLHDLAEAPFEITAADRSPERAELMKKNFLRCGLKNVQTITADAVKADFPEKQYDLVFIDAPCSNTGVARRRPDVLWRFSQNRVLESAKLQSRILSALADKVKSGGYLLYSTCSIEPEENKKQIRAFLEKHPEFAILKEQLLTPTQIHDGAYAALLFKPLIPVN